MGKNNTTGHEQVEETWYYQEMANQIKKMKDKRNKLGTFTSWVWQKEENKIILALTDYLREREGLTPGVQVFDGVMVERQVHHPALLDEKILRWSEAFLEEEMGFVIKLIEKPLTPTKADFDRYWGERALQKIGNDEAKQLYLLAREGHPVVTWLLVKIPSTFSFSSCLLL
jgi:hypothetical protein